MHADCYPIDETALTIIVNDVHIDIYPDTYPPPKEMYHNMYPENLSDLIRTVIRDGDIDTEHISIVT